MNCNPLIPRPFATMPNLRQLYHAQIGSLEYDPREVGDAWTGEDTLTAETHNTETVRGLPAIRIEEEGAAADGRAATLDRVFELYPEDRTKLIGISIDYRAVALTLGHLRLEVVDVTNPLAPIVIDPELTLIQPTLNRHHTRFDPAGGERFMLRFVETAAAQAAGGQPHILVGQVRAGRGIGPVVRRHTLSREFSIAHGSIVNELYWGAFAASSTLSTSEGVLSQEPKLSLPPGKILRGEYSHVRTGGVDTVPANATMKVYLIDGFTSILSEQHMVDVPEVTANWYTDQYPFTCPADCGLYLDGAFVNIGWLIDTAATFGPHSHRGSRIWFDYSEFGEA